MNLVITDGRRAINPELPEYKEITLELSKLVNAAARKNSNAPKNLTYLKDKKLEPFPIYTGANVWCYTN